MRVDSIKARFLNLIGAYRAYWWWKDRCIPTWINLRVRWSVRKSKSICSPTVPLLVLVDNTVLRHATTHGSATIPTGEIMLGDDVIPSYYSVRIPVVDEGEITALDPTSSAANRKTIAMYDSVKFLSGIAYLAKTGAIKLCTSAVLLAEQEFPSKDKDGNPKPRPPFHEIGYDDLNLLSEIELEPIDGYFLSEIGGGTSKFPYTKERVESFLCGVDDARYKEIRNSLKAKDTQDAWHIRTAEKFGALCFLTMDYTLLETLEKRKDKSAISNLTTNVWSPADLGKYLGLEQMSPYLMSRNRADGPVQNEVDTPSRTRTKIQDWD